MPMPFPQHEGSRDLAPARDSEGHKRSETFEEKIEYQGKWISVVSLKKVF